MTWTGSVRSPLFSRLPPLLLRHRLTSPRSSLLFLPLPPNTPSPTPGLTTHISRKYLTSATPLPPFHLDHRLLIDTSSLLPNHPVSTHPRRYTQFLTLSHLPGNTYVGTSSST